MSKVIFVTEFAALIRHWTRVPFLKEHSKNEHPLITDQELLHAVKLVIQVLLGVNLQEARRVEIRPYSTSSPAAPIITLEQNIQIARSNAMFKTMEDLHPSSESTCVKWVHHLLPKIPQEMDIKYDTLLPPADKFISRSNPRIHVPFTISPDASIREQAETDEIPEATEQQTDKMNKKLLRNMIKLLRKSATDVLQNIDKLEKEMFPRRPKHIPRPTIVVTQEPNGSSSTSGPAPMLRREELPQKPKPLRRPTIFGTQEPSSSSSTTGHWSTSGAVSSGPLSLPKKFLPRNLQGYSSSSTDTSTPKKSYHSKDDCAMITAEQRRDAGMSPGSSHKKLSKKIPKKSPPSTFRTARNPKYAHIQSTIPKVASTSKYQ